MNHRALIFAAPLAMAFASTAAAQQPPASSVLAQGVRAYQQLELSSASRLLRLSLGIRGADSLTTIERTSALMHLFAVEQLNGQRDSAAAVSLRLLTADPRYQPDALVFPPEIVTALERRRREVKIVAAVPGYAATLRPREELQIALVATSITPVQAVVVREDNNQGLVTLFDGNIEDSLDITWNLLDPEGAVAPPGRYHVAVTTRDARGRARTLRLPFEIRGSATMIAAAEPAPAEPDVPVVTRTGSSLSFFGGLGGGLYSARSTTPAGEAKFSGPGLAGDGGLAIGRFSLRVGYGEASLKAGEGATGTRKLIEGSAMLGIRTLPFLTFWVGPHARAWETDAGSQRWLLWEIRADARHEFVPGVLGVSVAGWSVAGATVDAAAPFERGIGVQGSMDLRLTRTGPFVASVSYRIERARVAQNLQHEANDVLGLWLRYQPSR